MTAKLREAVAFLFRRAGEAELSEEDFVRQASLDLHWFSPKDGRRFLDGARSLGYLADGSAPHRVRPAFDPQSVEVPLDFRVDTRVLEEAPAARAGSVTEELVAAAASSGHLPMDAVWREVRAKAAEKVLTESAAAALVASQAGVDVVPFLGRVNADIAKSRSATPSAS